MTPLRQQSPRTITEHVVVVVGVPVIAGIAFADATNHRLLVGIALLVAIVLAGVSLFVPPEPPRWLWTCRIAAFTLAVFGYITALAEESPPRDATSLGSSQPSGSGAPARDGATVPTSTPSPSPAPSITAMSAYPTDCPTPGGGNVALSVLVEVIYWCFGSVLSTSGEYIDTQRQVKVRLGIENTCDREISISVANPSRVRLVVDGENMAQRWAPGDKTFNAGDRPEQVLIDGERYWTIPPNVNLDEDPVPSLNTYTGFASKWAMPPTLAPGAKAGGGTRIGDGGVTYDGPDRDSDLVFQVPVDSADAPIDIVGVGVFEIPKNERAGEGWTLVGLAPFDEWGPQLAPGFF